MSLIDAVARRRQEEQLNSARTRLEVRFPSHEAAGRRCAVPGCKRGLREENRSGFCDAHWYQSRRRKCAAEGCERMLGWKNKIGLCRDHRSSHPQNGGVTMATMKPQQAARKPETFRAYTLRRRGGGWVMATVLCAETDIVDETAPDDRQAGLSRIEDELRRLE